MHDVLHYRSPWSLATPTHYLLGGSYVAKLGIFGYLYLCDEGEGGSDERGRERERHRDCRRFSQRET